MSSDAREPATTTDPTVPAEASSRTMGLPQATSLVVGTVIGVGIFNVPASLVGYARAAFVNTGHGTAGTIVLTLAGIWAAAAINLRGIRSMGQIQLWTSVIKFLAQITWRLADGRAITRSRLVRDLAVAGVSFAVSVLFIVHSANTDATGFAVYYPFLYALGAFLLGVPVYLVNRTRMTPPPGPPPPVDAIDTARTAPASAPTTP